MAMIDCICQRCGQSFRREHWRVDKWGGKFCSVKCNVQSNLLSAERRDQAVKTKLTSPKMGHPTAFVCDCCGQTFVKYAGQRPKPLKFCDRHCMTLYQRGHRPEGQADIELATHPKPTEPEYLIEYDPQTKQLRNKEP